eukprot:m.171713 g.171713  ORF g.171713 m.171713 type:complete len:355 (+) comp21268_c0_seq2:141-1205(+)
MLTATLRIYHCMQVKREERERERGGHNKTQRQQSVRAKRVHCFQAGPHERAPLLLAAAGAAAPAPLPSVGKAAAELSHGAFLIFSSFLPACLGSFCGLVSFMYLRSSSRSSTSCIMSSSMLSSSSLQSSTASCMPWISTSSLLSRGKVMRTLNLSCSSRRPRPPCPMMRGRTRASRSSANTTCCSNSLTRASISALQASPSFSKPTMVMRLGLAASLRGMLISTSNCLRNSLMVAPRVPISAGWCTASISTSVLCCLSSTSFSSSMRRAMRSRALAMAAGMPLITTVSEPSSALPGNLMRTLASSCSLRISSPLVPISSRWKASGTVMSSLTGMSACSAACAFSQFSGWPVMRM